MISALFFTALVFVLWLSCRSTSLSYLSLPAILAVFYLTYFHLIPALAGFSRFATDYAHYEDLIPYAQSLSAIYVCAAVIPLFMWRKYLSPHLIHWSEERQPLGHFGIEYFVGWALVLCVIFLIGDLNLNSYGSLVFLDRGKVAGLDFLLQAFNLLIPLTLLALIKAKFSAKSVVILVVSIILLLAFGTRAKIFLLVTAAITAWFIVRRKQPPLFLGLLGFLLALAIANLISNFRVYGLGLVFYDRESLSFYELLDFRGESVLAIVTAGSIELGSPFIMFEPWLVAIGRLVPSIIWPDKPSADYLALSTQFIYGPGVDQMGLAPPHLAEVFWQFGWLGVPILAFSYFSIIVWLYKKISKRAEIFRVAFFALAPFFFGFYLQSRGYFFQILSDGIFTIGPLFLLRYFPEDRDRHRLTTNVTYRSSV